MGGGLHLPASFTERDLEEGRELGREDGLCVLGVGVERPRICGRGTAMVFDVFPGG